MIMYTEYFKCMVQSGRIFLTFIFVVGFFWQIEITSGAETTNTLTSLLDDLHSSDPAKRFTARKELGGLGLGIPYPMKRLPELREFLKSGQGSELQRSDAVMALCENAGKEDVQILAEKLREKVAKGLQVSETYEVARLLFFIAKSGGAGNVPMTRDVLPKLFKFKKPDSHLSSAIALATISICLHGDRQVESLLDEMEKEQVGQTESKKNTDAFDWQDSRDPQKVLFGIRYGKNLLAKKKPLESTWDLLERDEHYWVRLYARLLAIQLIDMSRSGFSNWHMKEPSPDNKMKVVDHFRSVEKPDILWFPVYDDKELNAVMEAWKFRLENRLKHPLLLDKNEQESDSERIRGLLKSRGHHWLDVKKRCVEQIYSDEEILEHLSMILRGYTKDERTEKPIFRGDFCL